LNDLLIVAECQWISILAKFMMRANLHKIINVCKR